MCLALIVCRRGGASGYIVQLSVPVTTLAGVCGRCGRRAQVGMMLAMMWSRGKRPVTTEVGSRRWTVRGRQQLNSRRVSSTGTQGLLSSSRHGAISGLSGSNLYRYTSTLWTREEQNFSQIAAADRSRAAATNGWGQTWGRLQRNRLGETASPSWVAMWVSDGLSSSTRDTAK